MPRNRFSLLDLQAEVKFLRRRFLGSRVINVYDVTPTTYLLKLSVSSRNAGSTEDHVGVTEEPSSSNWEKSFIIIESGIRVHETRFYREKSNIPSGFSVKLRKHIRSRKIQQIRTIGADRVIELVFSSRVVEGILEKPCRLIVEFYSSGNIILTDEEYIILSALRSYKGPFGVTKEPVHIFTKNKYPVHLLRSDISLSKSSVLYLLKEGSQTESVRNFLASKLSCGPQVVEHALAASGLGPKTKLKDLFVVKEDSQEDIPFKTLCFLENLEAFEPYLCDSENTRDNISLEGGYIFYKKDVSMTDSQSNDASVSEGIIYEDFSPFLLCQLSTKPYMQFSTFNEAVDIYFANLEKERAKLVTSKQESIVSKKVDSLRKDLERRVEELEREKEENFKIAEAIELNADEVDKAIWVVRAMIASGVGWDELEQMLEEEKEKGNPVAEIIHSLHLERNEISLMLSVDPVIDKYEEEDLQQQSVNNINDYNDETEEEFQAERMVAELNASKPVVLVDVDLSLSAFANAARYFESRRRAQEKKEKTMEATKRALNVAEKKATKQVEHSRQKSLKSAVAIREIRKPAWFEKFDWFISSENFLIIAGKDAQQNELVVKRYMRSCDVYVHADIHGASSVVVKNHVMNKPIPLQTLVEAGAFAMCHSSAWNSKIVSSAWWVYSSQVTKTAPSGEYLTTGSFMIRGKKNYLPPSQLVMGYGILFKMDPSCVADHENERKRQILDKPDATEGQLETNDNSTETDANQRNLETLTENAIATGKQLNYENKVQEQDTEYLFERYQESLPDSLRTLQLDSGNTLLEREVAKSEFQSEENFEFITHNTGKKQKKTSTDVGQAKPNQSKTFGQNKCTPVDPMENVDLNKLPRGKRSKIKRAKKKYAEQTTEERKLAMVLLGSSQSEDIPSLSKVENKREEFPSNIYKEKRSYRIENPVQEIRNYNEELKETEDEENNNTDIPDETSIINFFTGQPLESDILEFAVPVCAPLAAVSRYKYRIKLIPGSMKKGKAAKVANTLLVKMAENNANSRDRDLIRAIPDQDSIQTMISNVKILSPGLQEVISKKKNK